VIQGDTSPRDVGKHPRFKTRYFTLTKAISNSVATKENLFRRHCSPSPSCPICNVSVETIEHLICFSSVDTPHGCSVKLNCDAAFKDSSAAFGIVVQDSTGCLCYVLGNRCDAISPIHAEIIAVHSACSLAYNRGWLNAIVESYSQVAISLSSLESP
ncbi:reverse transcriptase, partial [Tanacetum coccineum]